jgi:hypothetical protein
MIMLGGILPVGYRFFLFYNLVRSRACAPILNRGSMPIVFEISILGH